MRHILSLSFAAAAAVLMLSFLASCGPQEDPMVPVSSVSVTPGTLSLEIGGTATLTATVSPSDATDKSVSWSSSNQSVATVSNGVVTAVGEGSASITATAGGKTGTCQVTVNPKPEEKVLVVGSAATVPAGGATVEVDIRYNVDFSVEVEASAKSWIHFIETKAVQSGKLVFVVDANDGDERAGKVTVKDKSGKVDPVTLTFVQERFIKVESVELDITEAELEAGGSITLKATVKPDDAMDKLVTWTSDNESVATVDGDGTVSAVKAGTATITAKAGEMAASCVVIVNPREEDKIKAALMEIYEAMDGPNWSIARKWDPDTGLNSWEGVTWDPQTKELKLHFSQGFKLKGEFPDCFDALTSCTEFWVQEQYGLTGVLPPSFSKLKRLGQLVLEFTSMTGLPDLFSGMPLWYVSISNNESMTGDLPESFGECDGFLGEEKINGVLTPLLEISNNGFTGTVPESWLRLGHKVSLSNHKLSGQIPDYFYTADDPGYWINLFINSGLADYEYREAHPFSVKDRDIPGYWPERGLRDVITGELIPYHEIVHRNKATVMYKWASWCNYSAVLLPQLKRMYEKYHDDGLEVIARPAWGDNGARMADQKEYVLEHGYDIWYNFSWNDFSLPEERAFGNYGTPFVNVIDNNGNIIFCTDSNVSDPSRSRFGYVPFYDLIPFLEDIFGPLEEGEVYSSTDYSSDGEVATLQKASVGKGINIVFLGDAYTDKDMKSGEYMSLMRQSMEEFFKIEPYKTFRDRFNVYAVKVVSKNGRTGDGYTTALGTQSSGSSISISKAGEDKCYEYALKVPGINDRKNLLIGVLVNSSGVRGITSMSESLQSGVAYYASVGNQSRFFGQLIRHEAGGHGFAFLGDEYSTQSGTVDKKAVDEYNRLYKQYGWYSNLDFTDDPYKVKWSAFMSDPRYKDEVGIYEGGANFIRGVYRPSENSMMNQNVEYYNAPSRWAIYQRIMKLSGEECSFEKFLEYDAVNRGKAAAAAARPPLKDSVNPALPFVPSPPPVVVP